ncbi:MAG: lipid-A-disaccharide synthase [Planctomycetota bacterium]|nr:lipid-A-disaccharide synthase [Planctomycetota bacterium]
MIPLFETLREYFLACADLFLALPRHLWSFSRVSKRRTEFANLSFSEKPTPASNDPPQKPLRRIFISCGDASGEAHTLRILKELQNRNPEVTAVGFGSQKLKDAGLDCWEPLADLNVMGFRDVAAQLPLFFRCVYRFAKELHQNPPDVVLLVDYPGLNRHLLRIAKRANVPVVDFVAPQLWGWAPWRIEDFKKADRLLTILPFEEDWYRKRGAKPVYIGHPLGDSMESPSVEEIPVPNEILEHSDWVGLLPGSRRREIRQNLPLLLEAAELLQKENPKTRFVLPLNRDSAWEVADSLLSSSSVQILPAPGSFYSVLPHLKAAWVASGTASLEVAARGVPTVVVYRVESRLGDWMARHALAVPHIGSLNLIAGRKLVPEHLGRNLSPQALAQDLAYFLTPSGLNSFTESLAPLLPFFAQPGVAARVVRNLEEIS